MGSRLALLAVLLALCLPEASRVRAQQSITVGPNVHVSRANPRTIYDEVLIAADPTDPHQLIACGMADEGMRSSSTAAYTSSDGGTMWSLVVADTIKGPETWVADPSCAYGPNGAVYFASMASPPSRLTAFYSRDRGRSWGTSNLILGSFSVDRDYITVDNTMGPYGGRVYVYAQTPALWFDDETTPPWWWGIRLWRSLDGGVTYERTAQRFARDEKQPSLHLGNAVVLSDGTFAALVAQLVLDKRNALTGGSEGPPVGVNGYLKFVASRDGGATLDSAVKVSDMYADWRYESSTAPSLAADLSTEPFKDRLYAVWADGRFGARTQIVLSYSPDKGKTWSPPKIVSDDRRPASDILERGAAMPAVAVNKDGVLGVSWYDRRDNTDNEVDYVVRFAASFDGGETFTPSVRVSEHPRIFGKNELWIPVGAPRSQVSQTKGDSFQVGLTVRRSEWFSSGHTAGLAADATGAFHPLWVDNRTGVHQMWTARVTVLGAAQKHGVPELASLADVTGRLVLQVGALTYDRASNELAAAVQLKNVSSDTIAGPVKFRITTLVSPVGVPHLAGAENGVTGEGAVLDFTAELSNKSLAPGAVTASKELRVRFTDLSPSPFVVRRRFDPTWLTLEGRVYAGKISNGARRDD
jgi:hypothetical protein